MKRAIVLALAPLAALAVGCAEPAPGTIADARVPLANLGAGVGAPVDVAPPRDARPALEHQGDADRTSFFFTVGVVTYWRRRGNYVTNDFAASPDLPRELRAVLSGALYASRAASPPAPGAPPAFELAVDVEHLYATHYAANDGTVVVVPGKRSAGGGASTTRREYASYGNVVLLARLVDRRGGRNAVIWEEHVTGFGAAPADENSPFLPAQLALKQAVGDAASKLTVRVASALDRLGAGPGVRPRRPGDAVPSAFVVERVSRLRDFIERVVIDSSTGRVVSHDIQPLANHAYARPGDWLLSRRTVAGATMDGDQYDALAHALAARYDIRSYDDANRYHFFGLRGAVPAPPAPAAAR